MSRVIEARGPVVEALKRYDPGLRVRWSHEKGRWAVDAPLKIADPNWMAKPVRFQRVGEADHWIEILLPEYSERNMQYRDRRYVVCWAGKVDWPLFRAIVSRDAYRYKYGAVQMLKDDMQQRDAEEKSRQKEARDERVYSGYDRLKFNLRKNPNWEDGTGVSIKGMNLGA